MLDFGKHKVAEVNISAVDYEAACAKVVEAAETKSALSVSALAVHGVMTGVLDTQHAERLNALDLVVPDGQPVRWALRLVHGIALPDRVYGPELTLRICARAEANALPVYFYGSKPAVLEKLRAQLGERFPKLKIAGMEPSKFRQLSAEENTEAVQRIKQSGAQIVFVGLGCPRQEVWAYENAPDLSLPVLAVGAAFDFHAGLLSQAPPWMQAKGLEWLYRLIMEPTRLWHRYLVLNPLFCWEIAKQMLGLKKGDGRAAQQPAKMYYG
ncbi:MAG: WecB/TagA/CpsF family glycosyltransferase [Pseudomonadota bacterium]